MSTAATTAPDRDAPRGRCTFKDLCVDAVDAAAAAAFWSAALGLAATPRDDLFVLTDGVPEHTVWVNPVPEPHTVKNRVHLDVHVATVAGLTALGARVLPWPPVPWTVLADPDGQELCAFVRPPEALPRYRLYEVVVDAEDPGRLAGWWGERFGAEPETEPDDDVWSLPAGAGGLPWELVFGAVPEPRTVKNRVHWDVVGHVDQLVRAGATLLRARDDEIAWDVLADPEGNEFCVFAPDEG